MVRDGWSLISKSFNCFTFKRGTPFALFKDGPKGPLTPIPTSGDIMNSIFKRTGGLAVCALAFGAFVATDANAQRGRGNRDERRGLADLLARDEDGT